MLYCSGVDIADSSIMVTQCKLSLSRGGLMTGSTLLVLYPHAYITYIRTTVQIYTVLYIIIHTYVRTYIHTYIPKRVRTCKSQVNTSVHMYPSLD